MQSVLICALCTRLCLGDREEAGRVPALGSSQSKGAERQGHRQFPRAVAFAVVKGRAEPCGRTEEEVVHLSLLISLVEVICWGWLGPLAQQIEEVYEIKNRGVRRK